MNIYNRIEYNRKEIIPEYNPDTDWTDYSYKLYIDGYNGPGDFTPLISIEMTDTYEITSVTNLADYDIEVENIKNHVIELIQRKHKRTIFIRNIESKTVMPDIVELLDEFHDEIPIETMVDLLRIKAQKIPDEILEKYSDEFGWMNISAYRNLNEDFMLRHADDISWDDYFLNHKKIKIELLERLVKRLNEDGINAMIKHIRLPQYFIDKYINATYYSNVLRYQDLDFEFIKTNKNKFNKTSLLMYQNMSLSQIRECIDIPADLEIYAAILAEFQDIGDKFIEEHYNLFSPYLMTVIENQSLSDDFIKKHYEEIKNKDFISALIEFQFIPEDLLDEHMKDFTQSERKLISKHQYMTSKFIDKYKNVLDSKMLNENHYIMQF